MNDVQRTCARLISVGARRGPEIIRFNANARGAWTPGGVLPLKPRPANSNEPPPMPSASPDPA